MHSLAVLLLIWNMHYLGTIRICCAPCITPGVTPASCVAVCAEHALSLHLYISVPEFTLSCFLQYDPQASGVIDYQALMKELLHSDYYALYLGSVDNTQNTLDATSTYNMITNLKTQFAAQRHKLQQVSMQFTFD